MKNNTIQTTIKVNEGTLRVQIKDLLCLEVLYTSINKIVAQNQQKVLNHFNFKNSFYKKHKDEPEFIKKPSLDYCIQEDEYKIYLDISRILNLKSNLYTSNKDFGPELVLNDKIIKIEWDILNLFFPKDKYIPMETRDKFLDTIKNLFVTHYDITNEELEKNTKKFKVFGACDWSSEFIKEFSDTYKDNKEVLNFLSQQGFKELKDLI